jgi:hypothetical protein
LSPNIIDGIYLININKIGFLKFMKCKIEWTKIIFIFLLFFPSF